MGYIDLQGIEVFALARLFSRECLLVMCVVVLEIVFLQIVAVETQFLKQPHTSRLNIPTK